MRRTDLFLHMTCPCPVSAPISWEELDDPALRSDKWTIRTLPARLAERGDLFRSLAGRPQRLPDL